MLNERSSSSDLYALKTQILRRPEADVKIFEDVFGILYDMHDHRLNSGRSPQYLIARNLSLLFPDLDLVDTEFEVGGQLIDVLAYDHKCRTFVLIGYEKQSQSVAAQAAAYDKAVRKNIQACESALVAKRPALTDVPINWPRLRQIFVQSNFTRDEIAEFEQDDLVDLCELIEYPDGLIINPLGKEHIHRSSPADGRRAQQPEISEPYPESEWFNTKHGGYPLPDARELYFQLKNEILGSFPRIRHAQTKSYARFYLEGGKTVCTVTCATYHINLVYATSKADSLPVNDFVKASKTRTTGRGLHYSTLFGWSDVQKALEYVGTTCRLQSVGYAQGGRWKDQVPVLREIISAGDAGDGPHA